jgi:tetratricopeptide (TPR) repeat protein
MQAPVVQNDQEQIASTDVAAGDTDKDREMITAEETVATGGVAAAINADSAAANTVISEYLAPSAFQAEAKKAAMEKDVGRGMLESKGASAMEAGMDEFAAGQYKNAAVFFEQVKDSQPGNYKAVYHLAYCYFSEKQYKKALETLAPILKDKENDFYKEASVLSDTIKTMNNR